MSDYSPETMFIGSHYLVINCPECSYTLKWFLKTETAMCDNCAHSFPLMRQENSDG